MADPQQLQQQVQDLNNQLEAINDKIKDIGTNLTKGMVNELNTSIQSAKKLGENLTKSKDLSKSTKELQGALNKIIAKNEQISLSKAIAEKKLNRAIQEGNIVAEKRYKTEFSRLSTQLKLNEQVEDEIRKLLIATEERKKQTNLTDNMVKALEKNLGTTKEQVKEMFTLTGLFTLLIDSAFKADKQVTELAKSLGLSKRAANSVRQEFVAYSRAAEDAFVNTDRLLKAQQGLTEQLGIAVKFSGEEVEQFARLTEIVGLTNEEAGKLAKFSAATGVSTKDYVADLRKAAFAAMQANKIHISDKELLSSISKLSAGILVKFQGNPKAIAQAVVQAKALGTSLEQVDKTAESLLDFESSIGAELEAELITGRQLNFERARAAALTGDQAALMEEMAAQAGSLAEFQDMNVIAQQSLAKAFGMSRDEMAEMLMKQEAINKYGDKAAELNAEQIKDMEKRNMTADQYLKMQEEQRSTQEKFNDAMLKLQDIVGNLVAGPFGRLLDIIASILQYTDLLAAAASLYITRLLVINSLKAIEYIRSKRTAQADAAGAAAGAAKSAAGIPVVGWALAAGVATALFATLSGMFDKADDFISPGYGKRMILSPEGTVALNDNDTIVAGTNLGGKGGGGSSNDGVIAAIANLTNIMSKQPAPQFALNVGGEQIGAVVGKQQSTGTQQTINSYKLA
jgi:hypothetical protein